MSLRCKHRKATESNPLQTSNGMAVAKEKIKQLLLGLLLLTNSAFSGYAIGSEVQSSSTQVDERRVYRINLPSQSIADSLASLSEQLDLLLLFPYQTANHLQANPVNGRYTLPQALELVLKDTGFSGRLTHKGVLMIELDELDGANQKGIKERGNMNTHKRKSLLATLVGLAVAGGAVPQVYGQDGVSSQNRIDEIIVTAQKGKGKSIQDTAMAISAVSGETIDKRNLVSMDDYLRNIPGVSMQDRGAGQSSIVIRGMSTNPQTDDSTAGSYFGEIPIANLNNISQSGGAGTADIKLVDIERVEVLRGPQGTLYGSGSMAGTVRIIPNAPILNEVEGGIATRLSNTAEAGGNNTSVQAVLNLPLIENRFAVRGVAYRIDNSGFVDNVAASQPDARTTNFVNTDGVVVEDKDDRGNHTTTGFRLAALWQITDQFDATFTYVDQDIEQDGLIEVNLDVEGDYQQHRWKIGQDQNGDEFTDNDIKLSNLMMNYNLGWGALTSSTSWIDYNTDVGMNNNNSAHYRDNSGSYDVFVQELRLSSSSQLNGPLQFVTGLYYEDKEVDIHTLWMWSGDSLLDPYPPTGLPRSQLDRVSTTKNKAVFGEVTYQFTDQWDATLGIRYFDYEVEEIDSFIIRGNVSFQDRFRQSDESGQSYKGALSYTPNENLLFYGQWAEGFRIGRTQVQSSICTDAGIEVSGIESDTSETFELGVKSSWNDNRITLNAALYRTNWDDIPVVVTQGCFRRVNAGKARTEGVEVELSARLTDQLQLDISASTVDGSLQEDFNAGSGAVGNKGDRLPGSASFTTSIGLEYGFTLAGYASFARLDYAYMDEYYNNLAETGMSAGDFGLTHLKIGSSIGRLNVDLFVHNLTNDDGLTWVESQFVRFGGNNRGYRIRPRTMGINVGYRF